MADDQKNFDSDVTHLIATVTDVIADMRALLARPQPDIPGAMAKLEALDEALQSLDVDVEHRLTPSTPVTGTGEVSQDA